MTYLNILLNLVLLQVFIQGQLEKVSGIACGVPHQKTLGTAIDVINERH